MYIYFLIKLIFENYSYQTLLDDLAKLFFIGLTVAARAYTEALMRVGQSARTTCSGGTEEIGKSPE